MGGARKDTWIDVAETAREQAVMQGSSPKLQDYRDAAKANSKDYQRQLAGQHGVIAMQALDELHSLIPDRQRHEKAMEHIQSFLNSLKGWS